MIIKINKVRVALMTVIFFLDDNKGMLFNNRRLSRDAVALDDIKTYLQGNLHITEFSEKYISSSELPYKVVSVFDELESKDFFLVENISVKNYLQKIDRVIIYWWNRKYPSDVHLDFVPTDYGFVSKSVYEFTGKSHEKITREIFER